MTSVNTANEEIEEMKSSKMNTDDIVSLTQEEYDTLTEKTAIYYFIKE